MDLSMRQEDDRVVRDRDWCDEEGCEAGGCTGSSSGSGSTVRGGEYPSRDRDRERDRERERERDRDRDRDRERERERERDRDRDRDRERERERDWDMGRERDRERERERDRDRDYYRDPSTSHRQPSRRGSGYADDAPVHQQQQQSTVPFVKSSPPSPPNQPLKYTPPARAPTYPPPSSSPPEKMSSRTRTVSMSMVPPPNAPLPPPTPTPADSPNKIPLETVLESLRTSRHSVVDLSNRALSPEDLHDILGGLPPFTRLNVSRNPSIDKAALVQILQEHRVEWLNIDECGISVEDVIDLLISQAPLFRGVEAIIHPLFLSLENLLSWNIRSKIDQLGIPYTFQFRYNIRGHLTLPFFGIDQLVQALMDVANAHHDFEAFYYHDFTFPFMQNLFGCTTRSDGQPLGESALQMIPPETRNEASRHGYCFILISGPNQFWDLAGDSEPPITRSLRGCQHYYGILLPEGEKRFVDLTAFFDHLQGAGWPEPKNKENLTQVLEAFKKAELLEDVDGIMKWLDRAEAGKRRYDSI
ncbi:hypothetical protein NMY22_g20105 [Coprinellus aureogranulatus]|nr:hypothetical protein NMY22_g20105 [Coprinellus aureogranulatus]